MKIFEHLIRRFHSKKICLVCIVLIVSVLVIIAYLIFEVSRTMPVATINGIAVEQQEFELFLNKHRAEVVNYFHDTYDVTFDNNFWVQEVNGILPNKMLNELALKDCISLQVQLDLGKKYGILSTANYSAIVKSHKSENLRRKKMSKNGQAVFGPMQYSMENYLTYFLQNLSLDIKRKMPIDWQEMRQFYLDYKDVFFVNDRSGVFQMISIIFKGGDAASKKAALSEIQRIKEALTNATTLLDAQAIFTAQHAKIITIAEGQKDSNWDIPLLQAALQLQMGEVSPIIESYDGYRILLCNAKQLKTNWPYDENNAAIQKRYIDWMYNREVKRLVESAVIHQRTFAKHP